MNTRALLSLVLLAGIASAARAEPVRRTRYPALSPDGKTLAFSYQGDLWAVPSDGGRATRLTTHAARDVQPVFSPDGKSLLFASNRFGNYDLFLMPAEGGLARRLTFHSADEFPSSFTPDGQQVLYYGGAYGSLDIYRVPVAGGEPVRLTWDRYEREYFGNVSPDGKWIAYDHNASPGGWRRRAYEGSNNADIWLARFTTPISEPKRLTTNPAQDFMPLFSRDGKRLYYVSDRKGQVNLWSMDLEGGSQKQLTFHKEDGARIPSYAPLGEKIAYEYNSEIWLLDLKSGKTGPVRIDVVTDERRNLVSEKTITSNPTEYAVSPDGKKVALTVRGDLFVVPATGGLARKLVGRSRRESHLAWAPDNRTILFCTDEKGQKDLHSIELTGQNEKVIAGGLEDETNGRFSPDGKLIAYHKGDHAIVVVPAAGGDPVCTVNGTFSDVSRGYSPSFDWSPDNKWLAFHQSGARLEDAVYVAALADGQPKQVSRPFRDANAPRWAANGKLIYFTGVAVDAANLYAIDLAEGEKPAFEEDALDRLDSPAPGSPFSGGAAPAVSIDFDAVQRHLRRVTASGGVGDALLTPSGRTFLVEMGGSIQTVNADARNAAGALLAEKANGMELTGDGSRVYFFSDGQVQSLGMATRDRRTTNFSATITVNLPLENRQVFDEAWWMMDRYFYDEKHNGVDWAGIRKKYEALLPYVPYKDDFYDLMSEMIQELRGSHIGTAGPAEYTPDTPSATAYLGIEPDWATLAAEGRIKIARVVTDSPADNKWSKLNPGEYILAVDGQEIGKEGNTFDLLLDRKVGRKVVLRVNTVPSMDGSREVALKPIAQSSGGDLEYEEWVEQRRKIAEKLSGGRVAYVHVRQMNQPSELRFKEEFISEGTGHDALIVDVRYNGGGNVAHRLLDILRKKPYVAFRPRSLGKTVLSDWFNDYLWGKPAALLINQDSASNSEMMAEGFRTLGIGPIVGVPTMGAVIATGSWSFMDGGTIRTPSSGVYTASGEDMELRGRQPDFPVPYDPVAAKEGRDPQLERAVQALLGKTPPVAANAK